jgi:thioredoxin 1
MKRTTLVSQCAKVLAILFVLATVACAEERKPQKKTPEKLSTPVTQTVAKGPKVTFVELGSVNCIPCKAMKKIMDSLEVKYPQDLKIIFHDVWTAAGRPAGQEYNIRSIPTQIFLDADGVEFFRHEGYFPMAELEKILEMKQVSK